MIEKETRLAATAVMDVVLRGAEGGVVAIIPNTGSEGQQGSSGRFIAGLTDLDFAYEISLCYDSHTMSQKNKYSY